MTLLVTWLVFPVLLALLAVGCGLLVERLAGVRVPRALLPGLGLATLILVGQLALLTPATSPLTRSEETPTESVFRALLVMNVSA